jgi:protein-disulfide isomerase
VGLAVIVLLLAGIVTVVLRSGETEPAQRPAAASSGASAAGGLDVSTPITVGDGPVTVTVYFDYLCPACGAFEQANGDELERLIDEGTITTELRPISFLDRLSAGTEYSTRAANALATVVDRSPEHVWHVHRALYEHQPAEGGPGLTDDELVELAEAEGVPAEVAATFADRRFDSWTAARTEQAFADGIEGTPTILVDGEPFTGDPYTPGDLTAAVEQAAP